MKRKSPFYLTINLNNFDIELLMSKTDVADSVGCNRTTITDISGKTTINNYLVMPIVPQKKRKATK